MKNKAMNRRQLCNLLVNGLGNKATNTQIIAHARSVLQQIDKEITENCGMMSWTTDGIEHRLLSSNEDSVRILEDIQEVRLYSALARLYKLIIRTKTYEITIREIYIAKAVLNKISLDKH